MSKHALFTEGNAGGKHRLVADGGYTDLFNRPDNSAAVGGSGWSVHNRQSSSVSAVWGISGNQAVCTAMPSSGGGIQEAMLLHDASSGDFTMTINLGPFFDGANAGASISAFRVGVDQDDGANGLGFWLLRNDMLVRLRSNEGGSTSVSLAERPVAGDTVKIVAVGDNIKVYRNNTQIAEVTDAYNMTKTWHGLASYMPSYDHFTFDGVTIDTVAYGGQHAFFVPILGVNDTFDRADGSDVTRRSDGGLWTPGGYVTYAILNNKLIRSAPDGGFYTYTGAWLYADTNYDSATMAITLVLSETSPYYGDARIFFCTNPSESAGFYFNYLSGFMEIRRCDTGATVVAKASGVPNMTDGADHTVLIKYNAATAQLTLTIDGTLYFDKITSGVPVSTGIALFMDRKFSDSGQAYSSISTSHTLS